jgi:hypothetical protein
MSKTLPVFQRYVPASPLLNGLISSGPVSAEFARKFIEETQFVELSGKCLPTLNPTLHAVYDGRHYTLLMPSKNAAFVYGKPGTGIEGMAECNCFDLQRFRNSASRIPFFY